MIRFHSAAADLSPPRVSTAAEAHPARSPCAFAKAVGQCHLVRLSHITGKKIAHGVDAHEAGSDVPTVIRVHSAAADLSPPCVSTAAEAHPARSPCAFAEAVGQWHLIRLSHITGKKIAHGRLSFCASLVSGSHCTRRSGRSVMDSRLSWHRRAVSVCATFQNWRLTNVLFCGKRGRLSRNRPPGGTG